MPIIRLKDTDIAFECATGDTITRAGLRAGIALPYECNTGACGTCRMELVWGEIESLRPDAPALTDRDRAKHRVLGCQAQPRSDCVIKARIDPALPVVHRPGATQARLLHTRDLTHDIREFAFELPARKPFLPGQYALLHLPGMPTVRAYSMSNIDDRPVWEFQIKRVPSGRGTSILFDRLVPEAEIVIDGPYGNAYLRPDAPRDIVGIAGGSGLAPIVSIARGMDNAAALANRHLHVFYGGRRPVDICGEDLLAALPALAGRFTYTPVISCPEDEQSSGWTGLTGFVHEAVGRTLPGALPDFEYYFAGPPAMTLAVQRMLLEANVPHAQLHFDQFY
jgi:toluene monooxygenase electron transfer component